MRTLFAFSLAFTVALIAQFEFPAVVASLSMAQILSLAVAIVCIALLLKWKFVKNQIPAWIAVMVCGAVCSLLYVPTYQQLLVEPIRDLEGETYVVTAVLTEDATVYDDSQRATLRIENAQVFVENYPLSQFTTQAYLPLTAQPLQAGDCIGVALQFYIPTVRNGFDRETYMQADGHQILAYYVQNDADEAVHFMRLPSESSITTTLLDIARQCKQTLQTALPTRESGFMVSLLFGDKSLIADADYRNLQQAGMSHMIAVSGMHLSILVSFLYCTCNRKIGTLLAMPVVLCMIPMAGCSPSVMRAAIMTICTCLCFLLRRENDSLTGFGGALLVLLCINPYAIYSLSLQLSFASTLGILLISAPIQRSFLRLAHAEKMKKSRRKQVLYVAGSALSCTLASMLFTAPILLFQFGYIALMAPIANLLSIGVLTVAFISGVLLCVTSYFTTIFQSILVLITTKSAQIILSIAEKVAEMPDAIVYWSDDWGKATLACSLIIILLLIAHRYSKPQFTVPICLVLLKVCTMQSQLEAQQITTITFHEAGDGQCITVVAGGESVTVIDCGSSSTSINSAELIDEYMQWNGYTHIDQLIFTAVDKAHARGAVELMQTYAVGAVILPENIAESETKDEVLGEIATQQIPCTIWEIGDWQTLEIAGLEAQCLQYLDGKLTIVLETDQGEIALLNNLTQIMLGNTLEAYPVQADTIVLSASKVEDVDKLELALETLQPERILLQSGYNAITRVNGRSAENILLNGAITITTERVD